MAKLTTQFGLLSTDFPSRVTSGYEGSSSDYAAPEITWTNDSYLLGSASTCKQECHIDFDLSQSFTISFWVYANTYGGHSYFNANFPVTALFESTPIDKTFSTYYPAGIYWSNRNNTSSTNPDWFGLTDHSSNTFVGWYTNWSSLFDLDSSWHHVMVTWDSTYYSSGTISQSNVKSGLTFYVNNTALGKTTDYNASGSVNASSFQFTGVSFGDHLAARQTNTYNGGRVDDVAIWTNHLLTSTERGLLYNSGSPADAQNTTGLTTPNGYWTFEEADTTKDSISGSSAGDNTDFTKTDH